ncbi:MAG: YbaN family protein [Fuerstiella sp.]
MRHPADASQRRLTPNLPLNIVLIVAGCIAVVAGIVGIILPGLPTTPFLLLASWCFSRSSQTMHRALHSAPCLGAALTRWQQHRAVTLRVKATAVVMMLATVFLAVISDTLPAFAKCMIAVVVICVMVVVLRLRTLNAIDMQRS